MKYLINLSYNGNAFYGYQIQKDKKTIEGEVERCLSIIFNKDINTLGASRTDRYVSAYNQYCLFDIDLNIDIYKTIHSINSIIDKNIYIKDIIKVKNSFNIRHDVIKKTYIYKINLDEYNPIDKDYIYQYCKNIDTSLLDSFINKISGEHNFRSFTSDKDNNYIKNIKMSYRINKKILYLKFESNGFLRYMIRNIVGLLLDINDGKKSINDIDKIFDLKDRSVLGKPALGNALYLMEIRFKK